MDDWKLPAWQVKLLKRATIKAGKAPVYDSLPVSSTQIWWPAQNPVSVHERLGPCITQRTDGSIICYIKNFLKGCDVDLLHSALKRQGVIKEIYRARKINNRGLQFAFVEYTEVEDVDLLMLKLNNTWFGSYRIKANRAYYPKKRMQKSRANTTQILLKRSREETLPQTRPPGLWVNKLLHSLPGVVTKDKPESSMTNPNRRPALSSIRGM